MRWACAGAACTASWFERASDEEGPGLESKSSRRPLHARQSGLSLTAGQLLSALLIVPD
jgi:hypothetical protein